MLLEAVNSVCFFFLMIRRPPRSTRTDTLFPYTTLFRSALTEAKDYGGQAYTSARLLTRGHAQWTHAFVEVRAKLACGRGVWPAIWMLGADAQVGWPAQGELDIMEHVGWDEGVVHGKIHTKAYNHAASKQVGIETTLAGPCPAFTHSQP